jgi:hypothetical protein
MNRLRALPWAIGICLLALTLLGANRLLNPEKSPGADGAKAGAKAPPSTGGTIALGTVDSDPPPVRVGPPGIGMQLTVKQVFVNERDGKELAPGSKLVQFDDAIFQARLQQAKAELAAAQEMKKKAEAARQIHTIEFARQQEAIQGASTELKAAEETLRIGEEKLEAYLRVAKDTSGQPFTEAEKKKQREENVDLIQGRAKVDGLRKREADEKRKLEQLRLKPVDQDVAAAEAQIAGCNAKILEAQSAIDACLVKVPEHLGVNGSTTAIAEQVFAAPGMTFGPSTREPLLRLIPTGRRVVRAEVDAEFAFRWADKIGRKAVIYDANNFALTYEGTVSRIATAFLPKRSSFDSLIGSSGNVLECLIEVTDPAPPGKPPLRVGQPVRVAIQ